MFKIVRFSSLPNNAAFSPAPGEVGSQFVYIKRPNGVCPKLGAREEEGIFHPNDRVVAQGYRPKDANRK